MKLKRLQLRKQIIDLTSGADVISALRHQLLALLESPLDSLTSTTLSALIPQITQPATLLNLDEYNESSALITADFTPNSAIFTRLNALLQTLTGTSQTLLFPINALLLQLVQHYQVFQQQFCHARIERPQLAQPKTC